MRWARTVDSLGEASLTRSQACSITLTGTVFMTRGHHAVEGGERKGETEQGRGKGRAV